MALFIPTAMNKEEINVCIDCGESIKLGWYYLTLKDKNGG
jgi:hypothetical protein